MRKVQLALLKLGFRLDDIREMSEAEAAGWLDAYCDITSGEKKQKVRKRPASK